MDKAAPTRAVKYGSMSRDRTWALVGRISF